LIITLYICIYFYYIPRSHDYLLVYLPFITTTLILLLPYSLSSPLSDSLLTSFSYLSSSSSSISVFIRYCNSIIIVDPPYVSLYLHLRYLVFAFYELYVVRSHSVFILIRYLISLLLCIILFPLSIPIAPCYCPIAIGYAMLHSIVSCVNSLVFIHDCLSDSGSGSLMLACT